ncbi:MAG: carboxypeptidase regulatory-like domain-containing protein [Firmicutes bacterium]|nr:carboxypeptidase regulatory-like domain-containing protein [Bacillota bacterium]
MHSRFWQHLGKWLLVLILLYLVGAYLTVFSIIIRSEMNILDAERAVSALMDTKGSSQLQTRVCSVFGDPICHAVVMIQNRLVQADNTGFFAMENLQPGRSTIEIFAGGYAKYRREINLEPGMNSPPLKYDTGLWPQEFLVDFHVFYKETGEVLGIAGFANGSDQPLYIHRAVLLDPKGKMIIDLLHDHDGFAYYAGLSSRINVVDEPQKALVWPGRMWQTGEFPPIAGYFSPGLYTLEVHYGFLDEHEQGEYRVIGLTDHLDLEENWSDPHLP